MDRIVNRIKIKKLYSKPEIFEPIVFHDGVNIILGEKSDVTTIKGRKTNGVGKSMSIEFINFCLLKKYKDSRVSFIPDNVLNQSIFIMLDIKIGDKEITIKRSRESESQPTFVVDDIEINFETIDDAQKYLISHIYKNILSERTPSFRELLSILIRDEKSEFSNILKPHDISGRSIPANLKPHLFILNVHLSAYLATQETVKSIDLLTKSIRSIKNELTDGKRRKLSDVKAELNSLDDEIGKMSNAIESFKSDKAFESIEKDLIELEDLLDKYRVKQKLLRYELNKIHSLPKPEAVEDDEVKIIYNRYKKGLGDNIVKSLEETVAFKNKIELFQQNLQNLRSIELEDELKEITSKIRNLDDEYSQKLSIIDQQGILKNLKTSLNIYNQKSTEYSKKKGFYDELKEAEKRKKNLLLKKSQELLALDEVIEKNRKILDDFLDTLSEIHEFIMGNKECSFDVLTKSSSQSKQTADIEMRIYDDGSHSVDRTKTFIYDMSLLFNKYTRLRHPLFVIHDNIFDVDQDTLVQSLNFLSRQEDRYQDFQYILTLNRDKIEHEERLQSIELDIDKHRIASFSKLSKFLKLDYQEI